MGITFNQNSLFTSFVLFFAGNFVKYLWKCTLCNISNNWSHLKFLHLYFLWQLLCWRCAFARDLEFLILVLSLIFPEHRSGQGVGMRNFSFLQLSICLADYSYRSITMSKGCTDQALIRWNFYLSTIVFNCISVCLSHALHHSCTFTVLLANSEDYEYLWYISSIMVW